MKSPTRRTTSNSGKSAKSTNRATSRRVKTSSATAVASFESVFGKGEPTGLATLRAQLDQARRRHDEHTASPPAATAPRIFKTRHQVKTTRLARHIRDLQEAIKAVTG